MLVFNIAVIGLIVLNVLHSILFHIRFKNIYDFYIF